MARCSRHPQCTQTHGHGGDFHVGPPVEDDNPSRRWLFPKAEAVARVRARLGPGPYVGVATVEGEVVDPDAIYRTRAGLDELEGLDE
jgi:hypothetical protein